MSVSTIKINTAITEPLEIIVLGDSALGKSKSLEPGQEKFDNIHHSYFHEAQAYIMASAADTNVVRFLSDSMHLANAYRIDDTQDFIDQVLRELEVG
ncbi:unnamed protein product [Rotaria sp. Silwood1]|nr:unnamed protein product [Rotaria sp. Silwood1]